MSFSPELWVKRNETYLTPSSDIGLLLPTSQYINFGVLYGDAGYGIRDNSGTMQFKHNLGTWADLGSGGGFADPLTTNGDIIARIAGATTRLAQGGNGTFLGVSGGTLGYYTPSGTGDVVGPASAVNNRVAFFDGTTGKLIKDSGLTLSGSNTGDQTSIVGITGTKAQFDTAVTDGNILYVGDITQYTDEQAQDAVGAMVATSIVYNDAGATLQRAALTGAITATQDSNATSLGSFTKAQLDTAVSDGNIQYVGDAPTAHTHLLAAGATDVTMTATNLNTLDDGVNTTLHFHDSDRNRANHTGTQLASTISDFTETAQDAVGAMVASSTFVSLTYVDGTPSLTPALSATGTPSGTTFLRGDNTWATPAGGGGATTVNVAQTAHGLSAGNLIRSNGTGGQYAVADKDAGSTADAIGYVTSVTDVNNFVYQPLGFYITNNVPAGTAGDALFVGDNGALTTTEPVSIGQISKPVGILITSGSAMVMFNMRGMEVTAVVSPPPSLTIGLATALAAGFNSI